MPGQDAAADGRNIVYFTGEKYLLYGESDVSYLHGNAQALRKGQVLYGKITDYSGSDSDSCAALYCEYDTEADTGA